jgi:hypothetical protein
MEEIYTKDIKNNYRYYGNKATKRARSIAVVLEWLFMCDSSALMKQLAENTC